MLQHHANLSSGVQRRERRADLVSTLEERVRARVQQVARLHDADARLTAGPQRSDLVCRCWTLAIRIQAAEAGLEALRARLRRTCPACLNLAEWSRAAVGCANHRYLPASPQCGNKT
jgi:hypothetical protein